MKKRICLLLILLVFLIGVIAPGLNFVGSKAFSQTSNPADYYKKYDFENGTQGWIGRGSSTVVETVYKTAYEGDYSLRVTGRNSSWDGAVIDLTNELSTSVTYTVSMYVYHNDQKPQRFSVYAYIKDASGEKYIQIIDKVAVSNYWKKIDGKLIINTTNPIEKIQLLVCAPTTKSLDFYIDNVEIAGPNMVGTPGAIKSSTFESGTTEGWVARGTGSDVSISVVNNVARTGSNSLHVIGRTIDWEGAQIDLKGIFEAGKSYQVSVWVYQNTGSDQQLTLTMQRKYDTDSKTNYDSIAYKKTVSTNTWVELAGSYTIPAGVQIQTMTLYVESPNTTLDFYIDDLNILDKNAVFSMPEFEIPSLFEQYQNYFKMGVAIPYKVLSNPIEKAMVLKHFNSITPENEMKPDAIQKTEGNFTFNVADQYVDFTQQNNIGLRGHTLVWHQQTPSWFFQHTDSTSLDPNNPADKQLLRDRLKTHIQTLVGRYAGKIYAWDVVNEAIDENQPDGYRRSEWYRILGPTDTTDGIPEYILLAFQYAREADPNAKLFYNDYNTENSKKRQFIYNLVKELKDKGLIDGVGLQCHINVDSPTVKEIEDTIRLFSTIPGIEIHITELDISVYTSSNQTYSTLPQDVMIKQALKFKDLFEMLKKYRGIVTSVTFWGLKDDYSWLSTSRNNWPLLFDNNYQAKFAFWAIVEPSVLPLAINQGYANNAQPQIDGVLDREYKGTIPISVLNDTGEEIVQVRALWNANELSLYITVNDQTYDSANDKVMVFIDQDNGKMPELKSDDYWVSFARGGEKQELTEGHIKNYTVLQQTYGYSVEATLLLNNNLSVNSNIGFDIAVIDNGSQYSWNDKTNSQLLETDNYGILTMAGSVKFAAAKKGTPKIDAELDDIWENAQEITTDSRITVSGTVYDAAYATAKMLWDENSIYVYAIVYDPLLNNTSTNPWEQDSLEIFVDENNHKTAYYEDDDVQYRVNYENTQSFGTNGSPNNFITATKIIPNGYIVEAQVYMRTTKLSEGMVIGFDLQVNDADNTGKRVNVLAWNDNIGNNYRDTTKFGCLELIGSTGNPPQANRIIVNYGSPVIDGEIDDIWNNASYYIPEIYSANTSTSAKFKLLWDDNSLYVLAVVYDQTLNDSNSAPYQQDSVEVFLDEENDKAIAYQKDDIHYRVNYKNVKTADAGDILRFFSKSKITDEGYLIEARIGFSKKPSNGTIMGFEFQINDANSQGQRIATINMFDKTGNAWQNPSLFGEIELVGKSDNAPTIINPYDLLAYLEYAKGIDKEVFLNGNILDIPINAAEQLLNSSSYTQEEINTALDNLKNAINSLRRSEKYAEPEQLPLNEKLPDPFTFLDGSKVQTVRDWNKRADELKDLYQFYMYGYKPNVSDEEVSYTKNNNTLTIKIRKNGKEATFNANLTLPTANEVYRPPYPVIICIGNLMSFSFQNGQWSITDYSTLAKNRGYAVITFTPTQVAADNSTFTGAFYTIYPHTNKVENDTGVLMAWAWGASKILDVLYKGAVPEVDPTKAIVTGFSRYGKAALVAGAFDERFAVVNPHASGQGGAASFRYSFAGKSYSWDIAGNAEAFSNLQGSTEAHWFSSVFREFKDPQQLPFDQHELIALCAPRAVIITGGYSDWGTNPEGTWISFIEAKKVYEFLGYPDKIGFAYRDGSHAITQDDVNNLLDFCDWQLRGIQKEGQSFNNSRFSIDSSWDTIVAPVLSKNNKLKNIYLTPGILNPQFNSDIKEYSVYVPYEVTSINFSALSDDNKASMLLNNKDSLENGKQYTLNLNVGKNIITINVIADDNSQRIYTIYVFRNDRSTGNISSGSNESQNQQLQQNQQQSSQQTQQQTSQQPTQTTQPTQSTQQVQKDVIVAVINPLSKTTVELDKNIKLDVPQGAIKGTAPEIKIAKIEVQEQDIKMGKIIAQPVEVSIEKGNIEKNIQLQINYEPQTIKNDQVVIALIFDSQKGKWLPIASKQETDKIVVTTNKAGRIAVVATNVENVYKDMNKENWAYNTFKKAITKGLITGYEDMTLRPDKKVSLAEAAVIAQRAFELSSKQQRSLSNIPNWASEAINALIDNNVVGKIEDVNVPLTRLKACEMIIKLLEQKGINIESTTVPFSDISNLSSDEEVYLAKAVNLGIVKGYKDNTFRPDKIVTRAELITLFIRAIETINK